MTTTSTDVIVVGAGPVGLVAASELARRGVRARVIDKLGAPTTSRRILTCRVCQSGAAHIGKCLSQGHETDSDAPRDPKWTRNWERSLRWEVAAHL